MEWVIIVFLSLYGILITRISYVRTKDANLIKRWVIDVSNDLSSVIDKMAEIDQSGHFKTDDEVGEVFNDLHDLVKTLSMHGFVDLKE